MGLLVSCPQCKRRCSLKTKTCKCGFALAKFSGREYWISYYDQNRQYRREKVGTSKDAALQRLRDVMTARCEGRIIRKNPDTVTLFRDLCSWYLGLPQVRAKKSFKKDREHCTKLIAEFGGKLLQQISPFMIENYRFKRLAVISHRGKPIKPSTVNRELSTLKTVFNQAMRNGKAEANPVKGVKPFKENNARDRVLSPEEYTRLLDACPTHLKPIVKLAYHSGMRRGEILGLTWGQVDLREGFIKLEGMDTKTNDPRLVPLNRELIVMFQDMVRGLPMTPIFTYKGRSMTEMHRSFTTACRNAKIEKFCFHDLRHTFVTNAFKAGVPIPHIMKITGHRSLSMFQRYNTITPEDLQAAIAKLG
jgi:integrase